MKEDSDGAEPSASGVGAWNLLTLAHLTGDPVFEARAREVFAAFSARLTSLGRALPFMASALSTAHAPPEQIVVVGDRDRPETHALWRAANRRYRPFAVMFRVSPGSTQQALATHLPWVGAMAAESGVPRAYVCRNFACESPTSEPATLLT